MSRESARRHPERYRRIESCKVCGRGLRTEQSRERKLCALCDSKSWMNTNKNRKRSR